MKLGSILWKLGWWMRKHSPIYIGSLNFMKMFKEYRKVSSLFIEPSVRIYKYHTFKNWKRMLYIDICPLIYKYKYDEPRHEFNPTMIVVLLGFFRWEITFGAFDGDDYLYWESIIWMIDTNDIKRTYEENIWNGRNEEKITLEKYLRPAGQIKLYRELQTSDRSC